LKKIEDPMTARILASLKHFLFSFLVFSVIIFVLLYFWYPTPFFTASGGWQGLKIAAAVDLVLGPLLTLIVFDLSKSKQKLVFDLFVIIVLQFSALAWGVITIYEQRPISIVFFENNFITVPASAFHKQAIPLYEIEKFGSKLPNFIYVKKPTDKHGLLDMYERISKDLIPPHEQVELYKPFIDNYVEVSKFQVDIEEIISKNTKMRDDLMVVLQKRNKELSDFDYYSLRSKYKNIILVFTHEGEWVDYVMVSTKEAKN
jgi:hypothetical protein